MTLLYCNMEKLNVKVKYKVIHRLFVRNGLITILGILIATIIKTIVS